ncbi:mandelate racemase/muconate lactonizing enzyme family protein [Actinocorallia longicatena]|uniref:Mandelate racemase/muconate lactonizing enzyme family protein n=1 Tax=Actinocorallia longicatena TaxID=111803 RepID=A0ABP6QBF5_9ACTN
MTVKELRSTLHRVPLPRPWGPDVPAVHLIVTELTLDDGRTGTGFSWTPSIGAHAVHALLEHDLRDAVPGLPAHPEAVWDRLWEHLHEAGGGGLTTMALAAVDLALWDLRPDALTPRRPGVPLYGSGVNFHYSLAELVAQAERWRAAGVPGVKIKVGRPDVGADVERIAAVREVIGPDLPLMLDANQRWDLPRARRALTAFARFDPYWIEEPLRAGDLAAHVRLRASTAIPFALGENLRTVHEFRDFLVAGAVDVVQPNVVRIGGITPLRRVADLAAAFSVPTAPHLLPDLSAPLARTLPLPAMAEDVEDASFAALGLLAEGATGGLGLRFDPAALAETRIA